MRVLALTGLLLVVALSGCMQEDGDNGNGEGGGTTPVGSDSDPLSVRTDAGYEAFRVEPAVHQGHGLYEPTIDIAQDGTIYISSHSTGIGVLPSPAYVSLDDGATWAPMATAGAAQSPLPGQTSAPLFSDEIFIVAGDDGQAWGVDINLHDYIIAGWCDHGADNCYVNNAAYDNTQTVAQAAECAPVPLKDRPWAAYANGKLFMVNNPGGGPAQIAAMDVPPPVPVEAGTTLSGIQWNLCASSGGFIPGIPDMRDDHFFAVPQQQGSGAETHYIVTTGNADDVSVTEEHFVFNNTNEAASESDSTPSEVGEYGQAVFDADGALWVGAMNNLAPEDGGFQIAVSTDDAESFTSTRFAFGAGVSSIYLDGNKNGPGALVNWGLVDGAATDWYMGHLQIGPGGVPRISNVMLAVDDGPEASRHVQGAALGPDGRAYMVMSDISGNDDVAMAEAVGTMPLRVVVQQDGPKLPTA